MASALCSLIMETMELLEVPLSIDLIVSMVSTATDMKPDLLYPKITRELEDLVKVGKLSKQDNHYAIIKNGAEDSESGSDASLVTQSSSSVNVDDDDSSSDEEETVSEESTD